MSISVIFLNRACPGAFPFTVCMQLLLKLFASCYVSKFCSLMACYSAWNNALEAQSWGHVTLLAMSVCTNEVKLHKLLRTMRNNKNDFTTKDLSAERTHLYSFRSQPLLKQNLFFLFSSFGAGKGEMGQGEDLNWRVSYQWLISVNWET